MGTLFERIISFSSLLQAARLVSHDKRFRPDPYRTFLVYEKKPRFIRAAPFGDRVVNHALCQMIEPIFDCSFIYDTYACCKGKGPHAAVERASHYVVGIYTYTQV